MPKGGYVSRIEPSHKEAGTAYVTFDNHRSADYGIYIYMTKNYGDSFTKLTNGIPPEAGTVHVIREDPVNPNLLFAGTEFGIFVTFDRGANWHRMKNGLPTVPVFDIQIHPRDHDLILATHGRSFWIMDNISALEEMNDQVLTTRPEAVRSRPAIEWKMANYRGFMGSSNILRAQRARRGDARLLAKTAGPVRVTVADKSGNQVRQIKRPRRSRRASIARSGICATIRPFLRRTDRRGGGGGGGGGGRGGGGRGGGAVRQRQTPELREAGGDRRANWPTNSAAEGGRWRRRRWTRLRRSPRAARALVDPGELRRHHHSRRQDRFADVTVEEDPRVQIYRRGSRQAPQGARYSRSMTKEADAARRKAVGMNTALTNLTDSWKQPNAPPVPDAVKKAADDLLARVKAAARGIFEARQAEDAAAGQADRLRSAAGHAENRAPHGDHRRLLRRTDFAPDGGHRGSLRAAPERRRQGEQAMGRSSRIQ